MYHIWPANGQTDFINRQFLEDHVREIAGFAHRKPYRPKLPIKLFHTVAGCIGTMK